jgi:hypothetical protein
VLAVRATDEQHAHAVRRLSTLLRSRHDGTGLTVPEPFQEWARACAQRMTDELRRGGYAVHGDLDRLLPAFGGLPTQPDRDAVLRLVLTACVDLASPGGHSGTKEERDR